MTCPLLFGANPATAVELSKLPAAATVEVDFLKDIKPLFDGTCLE